MSPQSAIVIDPDKPRGLKRCLTNARVSLRPLDTSHLMLSYDFTYVVALGKQTSQLSL